MDNRRVAAKLIVNGIIYRFLKRTGKACRLQAISLEVTHRCVCRCCMCNIWRISNDVPDLDLAVWTGLLSSPELKDLRELDITGGEPFLRADLTELLLWICRVQPDHFPMLRTVAITTNGILTEMILQSVNDVIGPMQARGIDLVLACGMDAVGSLHDQIRGYKGAWHRFNATIAGLLTLRKSFSNLILGIKTTIIPLNVHELGRIAGYARDKDLFTIISPRIITANRFGNTALARDLAFDAEAQRALRTFYQGHDFAWAGHRESMLKYLATGNMEKPCAAGFNTVFVRHTGDVYPCPIIPIALGNIKQDSLKGLLESQAARRFRRNVGSQKECRTCTEPGLERLAWPFEGFTCLQWMYRLSSKEFDALARHMGLYKYL
ncbi:MAG: SPASM domain-containing protein [Desulfuromonadales bacterium]